MTSAIYNKSTQAEQRESTRTLSVQERASAGKLFTALADNVEKPAPSAAENTLTMDFWEKAWTTGHTGWHEKGGSRLLWTHFKQLVAENFPQKKPEELKVFVPLCGKAKDLYLFYEMGFSATVGVEYAPQAIAEFFDENGMTDVNTADKPFSKSSDGKLILGQGDLFEVGQTDKLPYPKYDIIWDRGSFVAINEEDRSKYAKQMMSLLNDNGLYLISVIGYDRTRYGGPPLAASKQDLQQYFGENREYKLVDVHDMFAEGSMEREMWAKVGLTEMTESLYAFN